MLELRRPAVEIWTFSFLQDETEGGVAIMLTINKVVITDTGQERALKRTHALYYLSQQVQCTATN